MTRTRTALATNNNDNNVGEPDEGDSTHGGLSSGAKAGIGIGAALGGLCLVAIGIATWMVRRRQTMKSSDDDAERKVDNSSTAMEDYRHLTWSPKLDATSQLPAEMPGENVFDSSVCDLTPAVSIEQYWSLLLSWRTYKSL